MVMMVDDPSLRLGGGDATRLLADDGAPPLRIAQVAPLYESVPPRLYGGTERVVSWLTERLVRMGHEVTLYASGDSRTAAQLVAGWPCGLRLADPPVTDEVPHLLQLEQLWRRRHAFDVLHFHTGPMHFAWARRCGVPSLTTLHGRLDLPELRPLVHEYPEQPLVSISNAQRRPLPEARWKATIHHGMPLQPSPFRAEPGTYLAFLGRISPEKRCDRAIEIARRAGLPLRIAAKVDPHDREYHERHIAPLLDDPLVSFLGELGGAEASRFLAGASALLFPIDWPEPFGLVMIEAMACGTPVVAFGHGSVPEVVDNGVTGFIVHSVDEAVDALAHARQLDRAAVRRRFEERFGDDRMARQYVALYRRLLAHYTPRTPVSLGHG